MIERAFAASSVFATWTNESGAPFLDAPLFQKSRKLVNFWLFACMGSFYFALFPGWEGVVVGVLLANSGKSTIFGG